MNDEKRKETDREEKKEEREKSFLMRYLCVLRSWEDERTRKEKKKKSRLNGCGCRPSLYSSITFGVTILTLSLSLSSEKKRRDTVSLLQDQ